MSGKIVDDKVRCQLPKFKDKVIFTTSDTGKQQSYTISSSFRGILRLSPNNFKTIYEDTDTLNIPDDLIKLDTNYADAIVFDGDTTLENLASIKRRMLVVSDSDSYAVDMRISNTGVEFTNLNVVGISKFNQLSLYVGNKSNNKNAIKIGNTVMPYLHNENGDKIKDTSGFDYDEKTVDVKSEDGDNSYFLYSDGSSSERVFQYTRVKPFIEELVLEALLDFQTIPTGSIHFVPITVEQYKTLCGKGNPNTNGEVLDPIVRDFLLCDGRKYQTKDFPELAKILWNETIEYWRPVTRDGTNFLHKFEHKNDYNNENFDGTFRVPDLRRMFISTIYGKGIEAYDTAVASIRGDIDEDKNRPGRWLPDNMPVDEDGDKDNHFHFMAYGTYSPIISFHKSTNDYKFYKWGKEKFETVAEKDDKNLIELKDTPTVLTLTNHMTWSNSYNGGPGFEGYEDRRRDYWGCEPWPAIAYMAGPRTTGKNKRDYEYKESSIGKTTTSAPMVPYEGVDNDKIYNSTNNAINGETYVALNNDIFGYENTPKFFACLPLIKI